MTVICDDAYWVGKELFLPTGGPCGARFDHLTQAMSCPHAEIGDDKKQWARRVEEKLRELAEGRG